MLITADDFYAIQDLDTAINLFKEAGRRLSLQRRYEEAIEAFQRSLEAAFQMYHTEAEILLIKEAIEEQYALAQGDYVGPSQELQSIFRGLQTMSLQR